MQMSEHSVGQELEVPRPILTEIIVKYARTQMMTTVSFSEKIHKGHNVRRIIYTSTSEGIFPQTNEGQTRSPR